MQAVLRLIKDDRIRTVDDAGADLFLTVGRQAVQEQVIAFGTLDEFLIDLVVLERRFTRQLSASTMLAHIVDDVSIQTASCDCGDNDLCSL
jgi:hypothetical protein